MSEILLTERETMGFMPPSLHRPDESIRVAIERGLRRASFVGLRNVVAEVTEGRVVLDGEVSTYYLKQVAQSTAQRVDGVVAVENRVVVR